jgi:hypothetical protein
MPGDTHIQRWRFGGNCQCIYGITLEGFKGEGDVKTSESE